MNKLQRTFILLAATCTLLWTTGGNANQANNNAPLDRIAAVVNSDVIMLSEAQRRARLLQASNEATRSLADNALIKAAIDDLIMERLQSQEAARRGLEIDDVTLNKAVESIAAQNKMNLQQFQQALQREGINYAVFREQTRKRLMADALRKGQARRSATTTKTEVKELINNQGEVITQGERYNLLHILVSAPNGTSVAATNIARQNAENIRRRILNGEDFAQVAKQVSEGNTAANGGALGWQAASALPVAFNRAIALLTPGEVSDVFREQRGFHIVKLLERDGGQRATSNTTNVRHILISTRKGLSDAQARQKATELYQQLQQGADFATLAKANSDDPGSAANGGELGWTPQGQTVAPFERVMNQQAMNTVSQPFKTQFGWHVLEVLGRKQVDRTGDQLRAKATEALAGQKAEEQYEAWLQSLRNSAFIEYRVAVPRSGLTIQ